MSAVWGEVLRFGASATGYTACDRRAAEGSAAWLNRPVDPAAPAVVEPTPALLVEAERALVLPDPVV